MTKRLSDSGRWDAWGFSDGEEEADPRVGLVNLADVMLVFACGLMLALVAAWNLDVNKLQEVTTTDRLTEVQDTELLRDDGAGGEAYVDMGRVYQDPETGKMYIAEPDSAGGSQTEP